MIQMRRVTVIPAIMQVRVMAPQAAAVSNGLLNALVAYWPGNEASGNLLDAHSNALHLTDTNTVTNNTGLVYATARQYTRSESEYHVRTSEASLQAGDVDFTLAAWIYLDDATVSPSAYSWASKWAGGTDREYMTWFYQGKATFVVRKGDDSGGVLATATTFGNLSVSTWYLVVCHHDSVNNEIGVSVNDGTIDTAAITTGVRVGTSAFEVGQWASSIWFDGRIGPTMLWKSAAGGGGVLTAAQRTALFNAGAGLTYAAFTA